MSRSRSGLLAVWARIACSRGTSARKRPRTRLGMDDGRNRCHTGVEAVLELMTTARSKSPG
ncbi:Uncharacterised protein [Mycobacteroides abscessus subsp. abscessus]|nr:Uncharacterised protein [Mycobacteroides abscessus subsp. abscessus]